MPSSAGPPISSGSLGYAFICMPPSVCPHLQAPPSAAAALGMPSSVCPHLYALICRPPHQQRQPWAYPHLQALICMPSSAGAPISSNSLGHTPICRPSSAMPPYQQQQPWACLHPYAPICMPSSAGAPISSNSLGYALICMPSSADAPISSNSPGHALVVPHLQVSELSFPWRIRSQLPVPNAPPCSPASVPWVCVPCPSASFISPRSATYRATFLWLELENACKRGKGATWHHMSSSREERRKQRALLKDQSTCQKAGLHAMQQLIAPTPE